MALSLTRTSTRSTYLAHLEYSKETHTWMNTATMLSAQPAKKAIQCLPRARRFSTTPAPAAISPYRQTAQAQTQSATRRNVSDTAKRPAQAAAATSPRRAVPSPAFNRNDDSRLRDVQRLQPFRQPEMDHSFVGMKGGEVFHEMMLRQGVKHICKYCLLYTSPSPRDGLLSRMPSSA